MHLVCIMHSVNAELRYEHKLAVVTTSSDSSSDSQVIHSHSHMQITLGDGLHGGMVVASHGYARQVDSTFHNPSTSNGLHSKPSSSVSSSLNKHTCHVIAHATK